MQGPDPADPAQAPLPAEPVSSLLETGIAGLRVGRLTGYFARNGTQAVQEATNRVAAALGATEEVEFPLAAEVRAAAFLITSAEGAMLRLPDLRERAAEFEPLTRDRLLAGALLPAQWVLHAQRVRTLVRARAAELFRNWDILVAPATPTAATLIGQDVLDLGDAPIPLRPTLGVYTQPLSAIGLPVIAAPVQGVDGALPACVQLVGAPWREDLLFRAAAALEAAGVCAAPVAPSFG